MSDADCGDGEFAPFVVRDGRYRDLGIPRRSVVWLDTRVRPRRGEIVRVGTDNPPVLRRHDPTLPGVVTGVARLLELPL